MYTPVTFPPVAGPNAIDWLKNFNAYARAIQNVLDLTNPAEKFRYWKSHARLMGLRTEVGINNNFSNAMDLESLVNGVPINQVGWNEVTGKITLKGHDLQDPQVTWAGSGKQPDYYQPPTDVGKSGADVLEKVLMKASAASTSLRKQGLTPEAIQAARAAYQG